MAIILSKLKRDAKRQDEGDWVSMPEMMDPETGEIPDLLVRGQTYSHFQNALSQLNARQAQRGPNAPPVDARKAHRDFGLVLPNQV